MSGAERYARWVLDPTNVRETGQYVKLACKRFLSDLERTDIYFDEVEAVKMLNFGERYCNQWEGDWEGVPVKFEGWQRFIFEQVYGWIRKDNGCRRFNEVYVQLAKKNGKSTMCAVLMNFHLFADERVNTPKIFTAANNEDQAKICVNMAGKIIEQSPELAEMIDESVRLMRYKENITEVIHDERNGFIKAFSKESSDKKLKTSGGKHGVNASLGVVDEFGMSPDHGASKPIKTSMASRRERLMFYITTAGYNKDGPCFTELRKVGIDVLNGVTVKDNYLPIIYEIDPPVNDEGKEVEITMKWLAENEWTWKQSSPNLDVSVQRDFLRESASDALTYGGVTEVDVKTLNFNLWCDAPAVFIPQDTWVANSHGIQEHELQGKICFGGLEIPHGPIGALALIFPNMRDNVHALKVFFWMPQNKVIRNDLKTDFTPYVKCITVCAGDVIENPVIYSTISEALSGYRVHSIAFPKSLETHDILQSLVRDGYECNPISQGYSGVSTPTIEWEKILTAKQVEHFNNPLLAWMNQQCEVVRKDNEIKLQKAGGKNVGIHASINALAQWMTIDAEPDEEMGITEIAI